MNDRERPDKSSRLASTQARREDGRRLLGQHLHREASAARHVVWYNGSALNPMFQAAGLEWCHGEAFAARLAAQHLEGPAQAGGRGVRLHR